MKVEILVFDNSKESIFDFAKDLTVKVWRTNNGFKFLKSYRKSLPRLVILRIAELDKHFQSLFEMFKNEYKTIVNKGVNVVCILTKKVLLDPAIKFPVGFHIWTDPISDSRLRILFLETESKVFYDQLLKKGALHHPILKVDDRAKFLRSIGRIKVTEKLEFPYTIVQQALESPKCTIVVVNDLFQSYDYYINLFNPILLIYSCKLVGFNLLGQIDTNISKLEVITNNLNAFCICCLFYRLAFVSGNKVFLIGFGNGANVAKLFIEYYAVEFKAVDIELILVNPFFDLSTKVLEVLHDVLDFLSCLPNKRSDLSLYLYCKLIFSRKYLEKTNVLSVVNNYSVHYNALPVETKIRIVQGVLKTDFSMRTTTDWNYIFSRLILCTKSRFVCSHDINSFLKLVPETMQEVYHFTTGHEILQEKKTGFIHLLGMFLKGFKLNKRPIHPGYVNLPNKENQRQSFRPVTRVTNIELSPILIPEHRYFYQFWGGRLKIEDLNRLATSFSKEFVQWRINKNKAILQTVTDSCTKLQCFFRTLKAKWSLNALKELKAANTLQTTFRLYIGRKRVTTKRMRRTSALVLQTNWRCTQARTQLKTLKRERISATQVQSIFRQKRDRARATVYRNKRFNMALCGQRLWRGYVTRQHFIIVKVQYNSALNIQRIFRGYIGRKRAFEEGKRYFISSEKAESLKIAKRTLLGYKIDERRLSSEIAIIKHNLSKLNEEITLLEKEKHGLDQKILKCNQNLFDLGSVNSAENNLSLDAVGLKEIRTNKAYVRRIKIEAQKKFSNLVLILKDKDNTFKIYSAELKQKEKEAKILKTKLAVLLHEQRKQLDILQNRQKNLLNHSDSTYQKFVADKVSISPNVLRKPRKINNLIQVCSLSTANAFLSALKVASISRNYEIKDTSYHDYINVNLKDWGVIEVQEFLKKLNLESHITSFSDNQVNGLLLASLTNEELEKYLFIDNPLHRKKILLAVREYLCVNIAKGNIPKGNKDTSRKELLKTEPIQKVPKMNFEYLAALIKAKRNQQLQQALEEFDDVNFDEERFVQDQFVVGIGTTYRNKMLINEPEKHGNTLIIIAGQNNNKTAARVLLKKGSNINHQNSQGQTSLHYAMAYEFYDLGAFLVQEGADDNITNQFDLTPYDGLSTEN